MPTLQLLGVTRAYILTPTDSTYELKWSSLISALASMRPSSGVGITSWQIAQSGLMPLIQHPKVVACMRSRLTQRIVIHRRSRRTARFGRLVTYRAVTVNTIMTRLPVLRYFKCDVDPLPSNTVHSACSHFPGNTTHSKQRQSSHVIRWLIPFGV